MGYRKDRGCFWLPGTRALLRCRCAIGEPPAMLSGWREPWPLQ
jgi:hypothetical protein